MISSLAESGEWLAGGLWVLPGFEESLESVITYLQSAWPMWLLFFIGIGLGYLFRGKKKSSVPESTIHAAVPDLESESNSESEAIVTDEMRRERKLIAELESKLGVEQKFSAQKREELDAMQSRLDSVRRQRDEKQNRFAELSEMMEKASAQPGSHHSLAQARAPVIHLDELVQLERQNFANGLDRLQDLQDRLAGDSQELWNCAESVAAIRERIAGNPAAKEGSAREFVDRIGAIDEHLRIFHQNAQGCLQRIAASKLRLQSAEKKLQETAGPIAEAEAALADLAASEDPPDPAAIEAAFEKALARLSASRPAVRSLENGIDQEISELTGRIDWVVKDSPKTFLNALAELNGCDPPADPEINEAFNQAWGLLTEARETLLGIELPLDGNAFGETDHGSGKHRIEEALENAIAMMESANVAPPSLVDEEHSEAAGRIAHLERQLALRESETARLDQKLKLNTQELRKLREENEQLSSGLDSAGLTAETDAGGNFVRRLLGLAPGSGSGMAQPDSAPDFSGGGGGGSSSGSASAVTLAEAREILCELKLSATNGSGGNGGHANSSESEEDDSASLAKIPAAPQPDVDDSEMTRLREQVSRQKSRIGELEGMISQLRKPSPLIPDQGDSRAGVPIGVSAGIFPGDLVTTTDSEVLVFRGDHPGVWNSDYQGPNEQFARPLKNLPGEIRYLRMKRLDTCESVVIPITGNELIAGSTSGRTGIGWSGKRERYFGGDHLGIYGESLPREVETKFGTGGWGFGHIESIGSAQAYGWAGRRIEPTIFEIRVGTEPLPDSGDDSDDPRTDIPPKVAIPEAGLIIFRSNNPKIWGQNTYSGANCRSRELSDLPDDIAWLRIRSLPGGESVILPVTKNGISDNGDGLFRGFNGSNELFYGARHLGAFDEFLPQEVETRFTYGGWGFGHCPSGPEDQACGWSGRRIDDDTVFEFTIYREMPYVDEFLDQVLEP